MNLRSLGRSLTYEYILVQAYVINVLFIIHVIEIH